ncbi:hypothetical protein [Asanoa siamensis]|uniref:Secreted protein n=1 Tax=Asanoa siamensis TaxID=926357 RepID=A0ABQ4D345_9ACTN|nr:hypothetical protein [Asanoa siamensis]GIF77959.1 hypothetical protein Asi02nite_74770 [Asanoa siamensis]
MSRLLGCLRLAGRLLIISWRSCLESGGPLRLFLPCVGRLGFLRVSALVGRIGSVGSTDVFADAVGRYRLYSGTVGRASSAKAKAVPTTPKLSDGTAHAVD